MPKTSPPLSALLPPLICGTATFNTQYNTDPFALPTTAIVHRALSLGVRAFDTSPYYGPAESLLGAALGTPFVAQNFPRDAYYLLTKVGRIAADEFDYSASWVARSVRRSLERLQTRYLDCVYCHDVEFVGAEEVLTAVKELRRLRDEEGMVRYVGISGYPVATLCELAEMVLRETGEPLDAVMSYANFTLQNTRLSSLGVARLRAAGVDVVPNASVLGMGLLRRSGIPIGAQGDWHPAPEGLCAAVHAASAWCDQHGEALEKVAIRHAVENWIAAGSELGSRGDPASGIPWRREAMDDLTALGRQQQRKLGVSVMGCSTLAELDETMRVWRSILDALEDGAMTATMAGRGGEERTWSLARAAEVRRLGVGITEILGGWVDHAWDSPEKGWVNRRAESGGDEGGVRGGGDGDQEGAPIGEKLEGCTEHARGAEATSMTTSTSEVGDAGTGRGLERL